MYTIEERLKIYERMLKDFSLTDYDELYFNHADRGFCYWYSEKFKIDRNGLYHFFENRLPELWLTRPEFITKDPYNYWFRRGSSKRIKCLEKAIETTKNLIKCKI